MLSGAQDSLVRQDSAANVVILSPLEVWLGCESEAIYTRNAPKRVLRIFIIGHKQEMVQSTNKLLKSSHPINEGEMYQNDGEPRFDCL